MRWHDITHIAELLQELHPDVEVHQLNLAEIKHLVVTLPGFSARPEEADENVLHSIQQAWAYEHG